MLLALIIIRQENEIPFLTPFSLTASQLTRNARMPGRLNRQHSRSTATRRRIRSPANHPQARSISSSSSPDSSSLIFYFSNDTTTNNNSTNIITTTSSSIAFSSSGSGSVADHCPFGSDRDSLFTHLLNLAARSDPGPQESTSTHKNNHPTLYKAIATEGEEEEEEQRLDPSKHSISEALKERQNRQFRSESNSHPKRKTRQHRPASLDFNGHNTEAAIISPRFLLGSLTAMKNGSAASSLSKTGSFPSPGTPDYQYPNGWSSERVPLPANSGRRYMAGGAVFPFNNGRAIPSKWEDAEKWICSPVGGENARRSSVPPPHHRRPKSKSGPLGPPAYLSSSPAASPLNPCFDSGRVGGFNGSSPFLAGVFAVDRGSCGSAASSGRGGGVGGGRGGGGRSSSASAEPYIVRSASLHGRSDTMVESCSSLQSSQGTVQDETIDRNRDARTTRSSAVLRKDVATQMSPDGSNQSSPKQRHSFSPSPSAPPNEELESHFSKLEVRDVQVDDRVTVTRWSKKHIARGSDRRSMNIIEWKKKTVEAKADSSSGWEVAEIAKCISKYKREEAKITTWENVQKAKAEAAIKKLEMTLEKKRSSSMDKILNKLKTVQRKAQEMRSIVARVQSPQVAKSTPRRGLYFHKTGQMSSLSDCFTCPAF